MDPYEGGVKVPTIYFDPRLPESTKGTSRDFLMHITDWLPTFLGFAYFEGNIGKLDDNQHNRSHTELLISKYLT